MSVPEKNGPHDQTRLSVLFPFDSELRFLSFVPVHLGEKRNIILLFKKKLPDTFRSKPH